jgi:hypothetical protein
MKFIQAVKLLPLTSIAATCDAIGAPVQGSVSKSASFMLLMGQVKLHDALVAPVKTHVNESSTLPLKTLNHHSLFHVSSQVIGKECTFGANASAGTDELNSQQVDLGLLEVCGDEDYICVQDEASSIGGRCVLGTRQAEGTILHQTEAVEVERELQCEKCVGFGACDYTDPSKVACGSCIGDFSCYEFYGELHCHKGLRMMRLHPQSVDTYPFSVVSHRNQHWCKFLVQ